MSRVIEYIFIDVFTKKGVFSLLSLKIALKNFFKGYIIGVGALIPGVSGGTTAILVGIFEDCLEAVANLFIHIRKSLKILIPIIIGVCIGAYTFSIPIGMFRQQLPTVSKIVFCTISLLSTLYFIKANNIDIKNKKSYFFIILGALIALIIAALLFFKKINISNHSNLSIFLCSFPLSLALVLPAISFSYMLLFFNIYDIFIESVKQLDISILLPLFGGLILGSFIFSKILYKLITFRKNETYSFVLGFVLCSFADVLLLK